MIFTNISCRLRLSLIIYYYKIICHHHTAANFQHLQSLVPDAPACCIPAQLGSRAVLQSANEQQEGLKGSVSLDAAFGHVFGEELQNIAGTKSDHFATRALLRIAAQSRLCAMSRMSSEHRPFFAIRASVNEILKQEDWTYILVSRTHVSAALPKIKDKEPNVKLTKIHPPRPSHVMKSFSQSKAGTSPALHIKRSEVRHLREPRFQSAWLLGRIFS